MAQNGQRTWTDRLFATRWGGIALWSLITVAVQLPLHDRSIVPMDEGHLLATVDGLLDGRRLYTDLHSGIFPGIYLITSGLMSAFGREVLVTRWAAVGVNLITVLALWQIGCRSMSRHWAALAPTLHLCLVVVGFPVLSMFNYSTLAISMGLLGLLLLLRYLESGNRRDAVLLGLSVAIAAMTKQNFGALIFLALLLSLIWNRRDSILTTRSWLQILLPIAASGACLTLAAILYFVIEGTFFALVDSTIISVPGSQFSEFNNPIPPLLGSHPTHDGHFSFLYTPPTLFNALLLGEDFAGLQITPALRSFSIRASYGLPMLAMALAPLLLALSLRKASAGRRQAGRCVVLYALLFSLGIFPSAIWSHLAFVMIPILLLFGFCGDQIEGLLTQRGSTRGVFAWRTGAAALAVIAVAIALYTTEAIVRWNSHALDLERARLRVSERSHSLLTGAVSYLDRCARKGEPVLVLPDIPIVYFLSARPNPSPFDLAIPGAVQGRLIVARAEQAGVRCAIVNPNMYPEFPPLAELYPAVHNYLSRGYETVEVIQGGDSRWLGMRRKKP